MLLKEELLNQNKILNNYFDLKNLLKYSEKKYLISKEKILRSLNYIKIDLKKNKKLSKVTLKKIKLKKFSITDIERNLNSKEKNKFLNIINFVKKKLKPYCKHFIIMVVLGLM